MSKSRLAYGILLGVVLAGVGGCGGGSSEPPPYKEGPTEDEQKEMGDRKKIMEDTLKDTKKGA